LKYIDNKTFTTHVLTFQTLQPKHEWFAARKGPKPFATMHKFRKAKALNAAQLRQVKNDLANDFILLSRNILRKYNFRMDHDDMVQEVVMHCFQQARKFDGDRGTPAFNYFTKLIINKMRQVWRNDTTRLDNLRKYESHLSEIQPRY
jgi:DNA-directed RNA polymerase specialized sigma24 family protein